MQQSSIAAAKPFYVQKSRTPTVFPADGRFIRRYWGTNHQQGGKDMKLYYKLLAFVKEEKGLTTVEYAVAGSLIALAVVGAFTTLGGTVGDAITAINDVIQSGMTAAAGA
jgi:pilus assembly protein Flp/PilA